MTVQLVELEHWKCGGNVTRWVTETFGRDFFGLLPAIRLPGVLLLLPSLSSSSSSSSSWFFRWLLSVLFFVWVLFWVGNDCCRCCNCKVGFVPFLLLLIHFLGGIDGICWLVSHSHTTGKSDPALHLFIHFLFNPIWKNEFWNFQTCYFPFFSPAKLKKGFDNFQKYFFPRMSPTFWIKEMIKFDCRQRRYLCGELVDNNLRLALNCVLC